MNPDSPSSENHPATDGSLLALGKGALQSASGERPTPWQPPSPEELQSMLPPGYGVIRILGRGGMGAVYLARQLSLDRLVAIKILPDDLDGAELSFAERFKNEARAMAQLSHPGIVAVYDFGQTANGLLYIVMEYIDGTDVAQMVVRQGRLHSAHAMAITAHVCDALAYAHARGIIHRDFKPSNIMISNDGVVKVADFGLAKMSNAAQSTGLTRSGMVMGTLHFMAPEALMLGSAVDQRADIYAVGVMLYQMLTGKLPQGLFEMPSLQVPGLDPRYDGIVAKALREDRALRHQSAADMRHELDAILTQPVVKVEPEQPQAPAAVPAAPPPGQLPKRAPGQPYRPPQRSVPMPVKKKSSAALVTIVVAMLAVVAAGFWYFGGKTQTRAQKPGGATKADPFVNSLGMKFVPVPVIGGPTHRDRILFSVWETRVQDYDVFVKETGRQWRTPPFVQTGIHPAVMVSWEDAAAFCEWLTRRERKSGILGDNEAYRLPSNHEWSCAAGIGELENPSLTPKDKDQKVAGYSWGAQWPPPSGAGNFADASTRQAGPSGDNRYIDGYDDGLPFACPVGSFPPNPSGLCDLSGNVWEWVEDWYDADKQARALRGASWHDPWTSTGLRSSDRHGDKPANTGSDGCYGFRCVLATVISDHDQGTASSPISFPASSSSTTTKEAPFINTLGMKLVPVPGVNVLFSVWETQFRDFAEFARANPGDAERKPPGWKGMIFDEGPDHPVGAVNWSAAKTFCDWLTNKERATGTIPSGAVYRLPKESEWLRAAADELENPNPDHPPGNFADEAFHRQTPGQAWIHGFDDGFPATSPVGSFPANRLGIHDLLGNVWEWCDEYYDPSVGGNGLLRGGACSEVGFGRHGTGHVVDGDVGFRIVLELPRH